MISAMTLGCLRGLRINASNLVRTTTKHIWRIAKGSAKFRGLSPWNDPLDVAFMGAGHTVVDTLAVAILEKSRRLQHAGAARTRKIEWRRSKTYPLEREREIERRISKQKESKIGEIKMERMTARNK